MNFLYKDGLNLLCSGKEYLAKKFYFNINNFLPSKHTPELKGSSLNEKMRNDLRWKVFQT